jgi:hypothetical protein
MRIETAQGNSVLRRQCGCSLRPVPRIIGVFESPIPHACPIVSKEFDGVHSAVGAIAATHRVGRAVAVAAPADAFGVLGMHRKFLGHGLPACGVGQDRVLHCCTFSVLRRGAGHR